MQIFNFMDKKQYDALTKVITVKNKEASFTIDFVGDQFVLYRVQTVIRPPEERKYLSSDICVRVKSVKINARDSYETCIQRLEEYGFYYCDEKFSYIHSDVEKAILSLMIQRLNDNDQLFFTTH